MTTKTRKASVTPRLRQILDKHEAMLDEVYDWAESMDKDIATRVRLQKGRVKAMYSGAHARRV